MKGAVICSTVRLRESLGTIIKEDEEFVKFECGTKTEVFVRGKESSVDML